MTKMIAVIVLMFLSINMMDAQVPQNDPLAESYIIHNGGGDELVTFSLENISIYKYYKAFEYYNHDTLVNLLSWSDDNFPLPWGSVFGIDLGDLDKDHLQEIMAVYKADNEVKTVILKADPASLTIDSINAWKNIKQITKSSPGIYQPSISQSIVGFLVKSGNLDSDSLGEFVTAYWASDGFIEITAYDVDDTLKITELGSIRDQEILEPPVSNLCEDMMLLYDIQCADFNGDGIDEILLSGRTNMDPSGYKIFANIYAYDTLSRQMKALTKKIIYSQPDSNYDIGNFNTAAGNFHYPNKEDVAVSLLEYNPIYTATDTISNLLIPFELNPELTTIIAGDPIYQRQDTIPHQCFYNRISTLIPVDVNNDGLDELLSAFSFNELYPICKIYQGNEAGNFSVYADLDQVSEKFFGGIAAGNFCLDSTAEETVELVISTEKKYNEHFAEVYKLKTLQDGSFDKLELIYRRFFTYHFLPMGKTETLLSGDLDYDIRIGKPKYHSVTDILQPLVILNAPPIHFDIFDNQQFDVCHSYNENESKFFSSYTKESQQSTELRTELNRDWALSKSVSSGFSYWGLSVSAHLTEKYGEKFQKIDGSSRTVTVGFDIEASVDDQIYATVIDYDLWEYPVYEGNNLRGYVMVVDPQVVKNSWFDSKSWKGYSYIPNHEVGNILSYRHYPLLSDNPAMSEKIKGDYGLETSFLMSANSSYDWFLNFKDFTENQATTTKEFSRDWGVSVSFWGSGFSMNGSYNSKDIQTQRTTVENGINLNVHMDAVDMSIGETRYEVTPYAYWDSNGALVIDYAVAPEVSGPGGEDTWWDKHYGYLPDPAFILPWHYDPEKGFSISENKRYQTNDIIFKPEDPKDGDTITIYAQVHNFSLIPTPGPVGIRFYVGDPDNGGELITGLDGVDEVFTDGLIPSRGRMEVKLKWKIPEGLNSFPRIYAKIDANKEITEIHEDNNKSWNILQKTTGEPVSYESHKMIRPSIQYGKNYPNPFSGSTTISFFIPEIKHVRVDIFNPVGQKIATMVDQELLAGPHEFEFNGERLGQGIYYCRITAGAERQVMKMVLIR
jgi:hypothetical protein